MEKFGCKLDKSPTSSLGPNLSTFDTWWHCVACNWKWVGFVAIFPFCRLNLSICGRIKSQDLNLIVLFFYQQGNQNSTRVLTIFKVKRGGKRMWNLYKRCHSHPLTSFSSSTCGDYGCVNNCCFTLGRKWWNFWGWWGLDSSIIWQLLPDLINLASLIFTISTPNKHLNLHYKY
jgi:hypothetical protein